MLNYRFTLMILLTIGLMMACSGQSTPAPVATIAPLATEIPATATPIPLAATATISPLEVASSISDLFMQKVPAVTATEQTGIEGVMVLPLTNPVDQTPLWVAYTYGMLNYEVAQNHLVGVYKQADNQWQEISTIALESQPSYLPQDGVKPALLDPQNLWLVAESGTGAHSGCFDVLRFDGQVLTSSLSYCSSSAGAGRLSDIDGDGKPEIILNQSDYYVFCYACGVQYLNYGVMKWDGREFQPLTVQAMPDTAEANLRDLNNQAVKLADAQLWQEAATVISQAITLAPQDPAVKLNATLIKLYADEYARQITEGNTGYPLLTNVFYGDYDAAIKLMQVHTPAEIFNAQGPLIAGTPAEGWLENIQSYLNTRAEAAIQVKPDLAAAYFLRAWGNYLVDSTNPTILIDLQKAVELQPNEPLFTDSLNLIKGQ